MVRASMPGRAGLACIAAAISLLSACSEDDSVKPRPPALDTIPPAAVGDLGAIASTSHTVTLVWTSPGDDGDRGSAAAYDIRCYNQVIGPATWTYAYRVSNELIPKEAGKEDTFAVTGLSADTEYYFAMKSVDEAGNWSGLSNVAHRVTRAYIDTIPPAAVTDLAVIHAASQTVNLTWTAPGDDGGSGAASYDVRYSTSPITGATWSSSRAVSNLPAPRIAGMRETCSISGLTEATTYYFALKAADLEGNVSAISNVASATTAPCSFCWNPLGAGLGPGAAVSSLLEYGGMLVVGGTFGEAGGLPAANVAAWDGGAWIPLGAGVPAGVRALAQYGNLLIAAGAPAGIDHAAIHQWDGSSWSTFAGIHFEQACSLAPFGGELVAGGAFTSAGGVPASRIAAWTGAHWRELSSGMSGGSPSTEVRALAVFRGQLVAGGRFASAGSFQAANVALWNGIDWVPLGEGLGGGTDPCVNALFVYGDRLIAGGRFTAAGSVAATNIAAWDGTRWSALGPGLGGDPGASVDALSDANGLVAGGSFTKAGAASVERIARWDGASWLPVAGGLGTSGAVSAIAEFGGSLYIGGDFTSTEGAAAIAVLLY